MNDFKLRKLLHLLVILFLLIVICFHVRKPFWDNFLNLNELVNDTSKQQHNDGHIILENNYEKDKRIDKEQYKPLTDAYFCPSNIYSVNDWIEKKKNKTLKLSCKGGISDNQQNDRRYFCNKLPQDVEPIDTLIDDKEPVNKECRYTSDYLAVGIYTGEQIFYSRGLAVRDTWLAGLKNVAIYTPSEKIKTSQCNSAQAKLMDKNNKVDKDDKANKVDKDDEVGKDNKVDKDDEMNKDDKADKDDEE